MDRPAFSGSDESEWCVVARSRDVELGKRLRVRLFGTNVDLRRLSDGSIEARTAGDSLRPAAADRYGLCWLCLAPNGRPIVEFPEYDDATFTTVLCGPYGVHTSAPRVIENFLDMAHLPYVHTGILGEEPHTEVRDYVVTAGRDGEGPTATQCMFWQPSPTLADQSESYVNYTYKVPRPFTAILSKVPETEGSHGLSIMLTVQPVEPERTTAWILYAVPFATKSEPELRARQELVFFQDKMILENQLPKRLPLEPTAERPLACDRLSVAYRRYLSERGIAFGVLR